MKSQNQDEQDFKLNSMGRFMEEDKFMNNIKLPQSQIFPKFQRNQSYKSLSPVPGKYTGKHPTPKLSPNSKPFVIKRVVYIMMLLGFMMIVCFYFDLMENYNYPSLILGFVVCIVFQIKFLQYMFKKQMYKMQIDQYGALRAKIKYLFGQLNFNYLDEKNRKKYYHHVLGSEDKLFDKKNLDIYNNTMQYLISHSKINHIENIQKIQRKWQVIITKYDIMKKFVNSFMEIHSSRNKIFTPFLQKINNLFKESDYEYWKKIMKVNEPQKEQENRNHFEGIFQFLGNQKNQKAVPTDGQKQKTQAKESEMTDFSLSQDGFSMSENNTFISTDFKKQLMDLKKQTPNRLKQQKQNGDLLGWKQIINLLQYKNRINNKKLYYMKQSVLDELKLSSQKVKSQRQSNLKQLQSLKSKYETHVKSKQQIQNQIQKLKQKMDELSLVILTKKRTTENNQQICKIELDVRLKKVQIQNLQVKSTLYDDLIKKTSYQLYVKCRDMNKQLQIRTLPQFNNKLSNYMNMLLDYEKRCSKFVFNLFNQYSATKPQANIQKIKGEFLINQLRYLEDDEEKFNQRIQTITFQQILEIYQKRLVSEQNLWNFFEQIKKFYKEINKNMEQTVLVIQNYQKQLFEKVGQNMNQTGRNINLLNKDKLNDQEYLPSLTTNYTTNLFYDRYFLNILSSLSRKDQKVFNHCTKIFQSQSKLVSQYLKDQCKPTQMIVKSICERNLKLQQQFKKLEKNKSKNLNPDEFEIKFRQYLSSIQLVKKQLYFEINKKQKYFVHSVINQLTKELIEKHYKIYQYILIHEKKSFYFQAPTEKQQEEQDRNIRFKEYQLYALKVEKSNFDDPLYQSLSRNTQNRNQTKKKPLISQTTFKNSHLTPKTTANMGKPEEQSTKEKHFQSKEESLRILNKLLGVLFEEWSNSQFFHDLIKEELEISLNFKRPGIVEPLHISHLKVQEKTKQSGFQDLTPHSSETYRCLFDVKINFKGKIAVHITSRLNFGNRTPLNIQLLIKEFVCPLRICFNPFTIGKSYVSLLERPHLSIQYDVKLGDWHINRIPFFSQIIKIFIVLKLRKKMLWPKRITLSVPLAYKNPLGIAIRERILFQNQKRKRKMN